MVIAVEVFWTSPEDGSVRGLLAVVKGVVEALGAYLQAGLVTKSILFCRLCTIEDRCK